MSADTARLLDAISTRIEAKAKDPSILKYFEYAHLPAHLQEISKPFGDLANHMADTLTPGPELSAGLRKLLEAKDCMVRAKLG